MVGEKREDRRGRTGKIRPGPLFSHPSVIILTTIFTLFSAGAALAAEFSAEMVSTGKDGTFRGKIYVGKDKVRVESPDTVTITRTDHKVAWVLIPSESMYIEQPFDPKSIITAGEKLPGELERTFLEKELVRGKPALKYEVTYELGGTAEHIFQWVDEATGIPVKTAALDGSWTVEYRNIQPGMQSDSLFEVPKGYIKFSNYVPPPSEALPEPEDSDAWSGY